MPEEDVEGTKSKKKLIIIIAAAIVLLVGGGVGAYLFLFADDSVPMDTEQLEFSDDVGDQSDQNTATLYIAMPTAFIFNVADGKRDRLVQIKVQLMVHGEKSAALAKKHIPLFEGTLVRIFGAATADQLRTPSGKVELRESALQALNEATNRVENKDLINSVLFTGFVVQ